MACQLNADGAGTAAANTVGDPVGSSSGGATSGATDMGMPTTETPGGDASSTNPGATGNDDDPPPGTTDPDTGSDTDPGGDTTTTGVDPGSGVLEISDGSTFDYGNVSVGQQQGHQFTVTNVGDGQATGMAGSVSGGDFSFAGGSYPGNAGSCGDSLDAGQECTLDVMFSPQELGLYDGLVAVSYDGAGDAERPVSGGGSGLSGNLLSNPGGEAGGNPPGSWTVVGGGSWTTENFLTPQEGSAFISGAGGPNNEAYRLRQDVAVDTWASTIDAGAMRFSFDGFARAFNVNNDEYRFRIFYRDGGSNLETWTMDWTSVAAWTQYDESRIVPAGTRTIRVELNCRKARGDFCDGYFDAMDLRAEYP